jgi:hypothetical protein
VLRRPPPRPINAATPIGAFVPVATKDFAVRLCRLRLRWERRPGLHAAFLHLAGAFICQRFLRGVATQAV